MLCFLEAVTTLNKQLTGKFKKYLTFLFYLYFWDLLLKLSFYHFHPLKRRELKSLQINFDL